MTDEELRSLFEAFRQENAASHDETRRYIGVVDESIRALIDERTDALVQRMDRGYESLRRHMEVLNEGTGHEVRLVAESVVQLREELGRVESRLDEKIDRTTAETHAIIRFSHAELDARLRALEEAR